MEKGKGLGAIQKRNLAVAGFVVIVILFIAMSMKFRPAEVITPRPSEKVIQVLGECEAVTVGDRTELFCAGGSRWIGIRVDPQPVVEPAP